LNKFISQSISSGRGHRDNVSNFIISYRTKLIPRQGT
jgi:hypothetical protein